MAGLVLSKHTRALGTGQGLCLLKARAARLKHVQEAVELMRVNINTCAYVNISFPLSFMSSLHVIFVTSVSGSGRNLRWT